MATFIFISIVNVGPLVIWYLLCGKTIKGKFSTNLKFHLRKCHTEEYKQLEEEEKTQKEKQKQKVKKKKCTSSSLIQKSLIDIEQHKRKYEEESAKQKSITQACYIYWKLKCCH